MQSRQSEADLRKTLARQSSELDKLRRALRARSLAADSATKDARRYIDTMLTCPHCRDKLAYPAAELEALPPLAATEIAECRLQLEEALASLAEEQERTEILAQNLMELRKKDKVRPCSAASALATAQREAMLARAEAAAAREEAGVASAAAVAAQKDLKLQQSRNERLQRSLLVAEASFRESEAARRDERRLYEARLGAILKRVKSLEHNPLEDSFEELEFIRHPPFSELPDIPSPATTPVPQQPR